MSPFKPSRIARALLVAVAAWITSAAFFGSCVAGRRVAGRHVAGTWVAVAHAQEIEQRAADIVARLDAVGRLHVSERHEMVFTGDWNGVDRRIRVGPEQSVQLEALTRIEPDGTEVPLTAGSLELFDNYSWTPAERLLRWRIKRQSDGVLDHAERVYRIDYVLGRVLGSQGGRRYSFAHDFSVDHQGKLGRLHIVLELDESWSTSAPSPIELARDGLGANEKAVLALTLEHSGPEPVETAADPAGAPEEQRLGSDPRLWTAGAFLLLAAGLMHVLFRRGRGLGHFALPPQQGAIDRRWIEEHLLPYQPELVGVLFSRKIGSEAVSALLARLTREGKLSSTVSSVEGAGKKQLELELRVPREAFTGYERVLIDTLFFAGDRTSEVLIRERFKSFDPSRPLKGPLTDAMRDVLGPGRGPEGYPRLASALAIAGGWALHDSSVDCLLLAHPGWDAPLLDVLGGLGLVVWFLLGGLVSQSYRDAAEPQGDARLLRAWVALTSFVVVALAFLPDHLGALAIAQHFGSAFALMGLVGWAGWPRDHAAGLVLRKHIGAARLHFYQQLKRPQPDLDDRWHPYLVALGLVAEMDAWFRVYGAGEPEPSDPRKRGEFRAWIDTTRSSPSEATEARSWTGGGGGFGGAGASGSWGDAATGLAAGIAAPVVESSSDRSSSSSSSDSSGPSLSSDTPSRSGGGSIGGW